MSSDRNRSRDTYGRFQTHRHHHPRRCERKELRARPGAYRNGAISDAAIQCNVLTGRCEDAQSPFYKARAKLDGGEAMGSQTTSSMDDHVFLFTQPLAVA
jgi:hypothetical protein